MTEDLDSLIRRSSVNDDVLDIGIVLLLYAKQRLLDKGALAEGGRYD